MDNATASLAAEIAENMSAERAGHILTMADEPELLIDAGQTPPTFPAATIEAARIVSAREYQHTMSTADQKTRDRMAAYERFLQTADGRRVPLA